MTRLRGLSNRGRLLTELQPHLAVVTISGDEPDQIRLAVDSAIFSELLDRGIARYGDLGLNPGMFTCRPGNPVTHAEDLYLAAACAANSEAAWICFEATYHAVVERWCRRFTRTRHDAQDLTDQVWTSLFLPNRAGQPRIASYEGLCSLATWLRTIVVRRAINEWRRRESGFNRTEELPEIADSRACEHLDVDWGIRRCVPAMQYSLRAACERLSPRDCALLAWRFGQDMPLGEIALRLGVHSSTVSRRIDRICGRLRSEAIAAMSAELHWNRATVEECARVAARRGTSDFSLLPSLEVRAAQSQTCAAEEIRPVFI
jgi:RNA polymerase sigma-70 factor (ECF subfamily)